MNDSFVYATRRVADIYIPPVEVIDDKQAFNQMFELHMEQKRLFKALVSDSACHEDVLELVEAYIGCQNMDAYVTATERKLEQLILHG